jgi:CheY-like chemotaxis protein
MSHEIRTPLNSVIGISNLLLKNNPRQDQKENLDILQFSAGNLLSIVNDILDYNKIEAGKIHFESIEIDLKDLVSKAVKSAKSAADEKGIDLHLHIDEGLRHYVMGDPTRLSQVINNLVSNAIKFTRVGEVNVDLMLIGYENGNAIVKFIVQDTGIGISKDKQKLIFDQFTQADSSTSRSFGGTGLGLAISKKILSMQGCSLEVESEIGQGSIFYFTQKFPKSERLIALSEETKAAPADNEMPLKGINILLVEDNQINVFVAQSFLEGWGATIDVAENGQEALNKLDPAFHKLVLMDLHMPVMDGYEAIIKIREQGIGIPIIALTATLPGEIEEEAKGLAIDDMVLKPFNPDELFKKVSYFTLNKSYPVEKKLCKIES